MHLKYHGKSTTENDDDDERGLFETIFKSSWNKCTLTPTFHRFISLSYDDGYIEWEWQMGMLLHIKMQLRYIKQSGIRSSMKFYSKQMC